MEFCLFIYRRLLKVQCVLFSSGCTAAQEATVQYFIFSGQVIDFSLWSAYNEMGHFTQKCEKGVKS